MSKLIDHTRFSSDLADANERRMEAWFEELRGAWLKRVTIVVIVTVCVAAAVMTWVSL